MFYILDQNIFITYLLQEENTPCCFYEEFESLSRPFPSGKARVLCRDQLHTPNDSARTDLH